MCANPSGNSWTSLCIYDILFLILPMDWIFLCILRAVLLFFQHIFSSCYIICVCIVHCMLVWCFCYLVQTNHTFYIFFNKINISVIFWSLHFALIFPVISLLLVLGYQVYWVYVKSTLFLMMLRSWIFFAFVTIFYLW